MGSSFVLFGVSMELIVGQFRSGEKRLFSTSLPMGKRYLTMGKRASAATTIPTR